MGLWQFDWLTLGHVVKVAEVAPSGERGGHGEGIKSAGGAEPRGSLRASLELGSSSWRTN